MAKKIMTGALVGNGVTIYTSTLKNAGMGLFSQRTFEKGDVITSYDGDLIPYSKARRMSDEDVSHVRSHVPLRWCIDGKRKNGSIMTPSDYVGIGGGGMANHAFDPKIRNSEFDHEDSPVFKKQLARWMKNPSAPPPDPRERRTVLRAKRKILAGEEILTDYGDDYWKKRQRTN